MKSNILNMVQSGDFELTENIYEAIYEIDGILVSGEFDMGIRGLDHNALIDENITWDDLQQHGMIIVPETQSVFGNVNYEIVSELGYEILS